MYLCKKNYKQAFFLIKKKSFQNRLKIYKNQFIKKPTYNILTDNLSDFGHGAVIYRANISIFRDISGIKSIYIGHQLYINSKFVYDTANIVA